MARLKRLTRRQKVLMHRLESGFDYAQAGDPVDLAALEAHGLIVLTDGKWVPVEKEPRPVPADQLRGLKEHFNG